MAQAVQPQKHASAQATPPPSDFVHGLVDLAHHAHSAADFTRAALASAGEHFQALHALLELRSAAHVLHESWSGPGCDPGFWSQNAEQCLTEVLAEGRQLVKLFRHRSGELALAIVAAPILDARAAQIGALCLLAPVRDQADAERMAQELAPLAALVGLSVNSIETARAAQSTGALSPTALRKAAEYSSRLELAITITNNLRTKSGCDQVALGVVRGKQAQVLSISGLDEVKAQSQGVGTIRAAMEECLDHGERVVYQKLQDYRHGSDSTGHRIARKWHEEVGGAAVAALPLFVRGRPFAVVALRRAAEHPFTREELDELAKLVEPYGPALELVERAHRGLREHALQTLRDQAARITRPKTVRRAIALVIGLAAAAWLAFGSRSYELSLPAHVLPSEALNLSAPFEGVLAEAPARAGDRVEKGQLLARLDTRELELERARLEHERNAYQIEGRRAFAAGMLAQSEVADARAAEAGAGLSIVERKISLAQVRAPQAGVVLAGDLSTRVGAVFGKGERLFQIAPVDRLKLELDVPEASVGWLTVGQPGRFAGFARPEDRQDITLTRIAPAAELRAAHNVFPVEAGTNSQPAWMRPGMEGMALIEIGERPLWWVLSHQALDWLHMHLWL